ncbi:budding uninhibited by benzimidazoles 3 [Rozella allomycis CSF55]|uniref:Budding uninhibited by benzimidazoles 3 n=1 Tax=Rozella allomycis (strain CSF55) TaxID=988480 RepID=A0A075ARP6_ROZAC|nr:hypothetical protein O9G_002831 [Rozella allomycis CSF55]RKP20162.1 budding uninhibited by benzimidazoles 3 [Rozella allomycis CSF55]|eukprot:EPZ32913.1 hypothetical protein O9G_002831 [Rozella allomycis CSF55]
MDFELENPPSDGISSLNFSKYSNNLLLATSWDSKARIYDTNANQLIKLFEHESPLLDGTFVSEKEISLGGLGKQLYIWNIEQEARQIVATHHEPIKSIEYNELHKLLVAGSWDRTVSLNDQRTKSDTTFVNVSERVYSLDTIDNILVVASANRFVDIFDLRNCQTPMQRRESSLKHQTRCIKLFPNSEGYVISSIEGRVGVEFIDESSMNKKYAFKCHRETVDEVEVVHPVNAICFHPVYGTFATGGSDGTISVWDRLNKKRIKAWPKYPSSVAALSISADGCMMAIASSYTFDEGEKE